MTGEKSSPGVGPGDANRRRQQAPFDVSAWSQPRHWPLLIALLIATIKTTHTKFLDAERRLEALRCDLIDEIRKNDGLRRLIADRELQASEVLRLRGQLDKEIELFDAWFRLMQSEGRDRHARNQSLAQRLLEQRHMTDALEHRNANLREQLGVKCENEQQWLQLQSVIEVMLHEHEKGCPCMTQSPSSQPQPGSTTNARPTPSTSARLGALPATATAAVASTTKAAHEPEIKIPEVDLVAVKHKLETGKATLNSAMQRWNEIHQTMSLQLQTSRVENDRLKTELGTAEKSLQTLRTERISLEAANGRLAQENARQHEEIIRLRTELKKSNEILAMVGSDADFILNVLETNPPPDAEANPQEQET